MLWTRFLIVLMAQSCFITCQLYEYHYVGEDKSWSEAQQYCREKFTDLATVSNMADMKNLQKSAVNRGEAWIGLFNQTNGTRTWHWSLHGEEFNENQAKWNKTENEPNDYNIENCGFVYKDLTWGDISCIRKNVNISFLCYNESETSKRFYLIYQNVTWLEAHSYCMENHTYLVSGWNQLQDDRLKEVIHNLHAEDYPYIGLFRDAWRWSDESSFSFRHWNLKLNDERVHNKSQCAMTLFDDGGRWNNDDCDKPKPFICCEATKFILIKENKTWEEALYYCRDHYHDLVTITNLDDQRWVQAKAKKASTPFVWMGLRYTCTLDFWFWVSDEVVSYENWASIGSEDDCDMSGAMDTGGHQWFQKYDNEEFNFICSK